MAKLVFDTKNCTGCRACELACSFIKEGVFSPRLSRIRVVRVDEEGIDIPIGCEQCDDAICIKICPTGALSFDKSSQTVLLALERCMVCKQCLVICPFGAIHYDSEKGSIFKCDQCSGEPECVKWCVTGGVKFYDDTEAVLREKRNKRALVTTEGAVNPF